MGEGASAVRSGHRPARAQRVDVMLVSLGSTVGLSTADGDLAASLGRAGATVALVRASRPRAVRTLVLTDLLWARAAAAAARDGIAAHRPRAILYSTVTASLLWPRPGAIRFDAVAAGNRPGRHGLWQRPLERRRLARAGLLVPAAHAALAEAGLLDERAVVVPIAVDPSPGPSPERDIAALTYAADPVKKGLDRVLGAWRAVRRDDERLVVAGVDCERLAALAGEDPSALGVDAVGALPRERYRELLRRARVYVTAPRREDYGASQLEALADGCRLVTTPAPGPYAALALARTLDDRLVGEDLAAGLRVALDSSAGDYAQRARALLAPFRSEAVDAVVARELLPALLGVRA